jgi:hypothetical protein
MRAVSSRAGVTDENATVGILVVQVRDLGTVPGKIPQASVSLTLRCRRDAGWVGGVKILEPCQGSTAAKFQPWNSVGIAGSRVTRSYAALEPWAGLKSVRLH